MPRKTLLPLSDSLFWDVDKNSIDPEKHAAFIVERVMHLGTLDDFFAIKAYYGKPKLKKITKQLRYLDVRVLNFCSVYFRTPLNQFRCYTEKQLNQSHWSY
ncbi:MAG: hypothetical protein IPM47_00905 [Sphingobacteriales bacterium]|nr:MAG: hypothetical protein IPM47_00905 [Sphingobacteriales bacterium]